jgi:hypothetical protein
MQRTRIILLVITLAGTFLSCNIINPSEDIPAIIKVDTVVVKVSNFDQGSASHNITCVKINVAGTTLGFFHLPAMAPCLTTGLQTLYLEPGIEVNGITGSRMVYPFFKPFTGTAKFDFVEGEVITISPVTTYKSECVFAWMEDFEDAGVSFDYPSYSDTVFRNQTDTVKEGRFSGAVYVDTKNRFFEAYSSSDFDLPKTGSPVLLEFDYLSTALLEFGMYIIEDNTATWNSMIYVRPVNRWNRIYIELNSTTADNQTADLFRPGFRIVWDSTGPAKQAIIMDNLKLIHY